MPCFHGVEYVEPPWYASEYFEKIAFYYDEKTRKDFKNIQIHIAFAISNGEVVAWASNDHKLHAEARLLNKLEQMQRRKHIDIVVVRYSRSYATDKRPRLMMSKPCESCSKLLSNNAIVNKVAWSDENGHITVVRNVNKLI